MKFIHQFIKFRNLYNFFLFLALINIFFSTDISKAKTFSVNDIEISTPFEINFNKNEIIDKGFLKAFNELIFSIVQSTDQIKLKKILLNTLILLLSLNTIIIMWSFILYLFIISLKS